MKELEGEFGEWNITATPCRNCGAPEVRYRVWTSRCGGYEDLKYECTRCKDIWWADGPDA